MHILIREGIDSRMDEGFEIGRREKPGKFIDMQLARDSKCTNSVNLFQFGKWLSKYVGYVFSSMRNEQVNPTCEISIECS